MESTLRAVTAGSEPGALRACSYPRPWRLLAAALVAVSRASLPAILVLVLVASDPPVTPPVLTRLFVLLVAFPALAAWLVARVRAVEVEVRGGELVLARPGLRLEVPCEAIDRVDPWRVPLPGPGVGLRMRSGRRLRQGLQAADPLPILAALVDAGVDGARRATRHPTVVWAHARAVEPPWRWHHWLAKFVLFALLPAAVLFYTHQHIAYGGLLGEYHLLGLSAWLRTFAVHWGTVGIYLVLWASLWRGLGEGMALLAAAVLPAQAGRVRAAVEVAGRILYYGGVLGLLLLRYLP